jgi:S-formylglutathione hydrolase
MGRIVINKRIMIPLLLLLAAYIVFLVIPAERGRLFIDTVHSPALEGNLPGDSADRSVTVYLPPGYDDSPEIRYPVLYLLHGAGHTNRVWMDGDVFGGFNIKTVMDKLITDGKIREMMIVMPDVNNSYWGSYYANSTTTGNWIDFIAGNLVHFIDTSYRTLPAASSRGIGGHSMGGGGALRIAILHPDVFSVVYGMSGGPMAFDVNNRIQSETAWKETLTLKDMNQFSSANRDSRSHLSYAAAFSPNPDHPPFFVDFPFRLVNGTLERLESVWQHWLDHDITVMVNSHQADLRTLRAIRFDCGTSDRLILDARAVDRALTDAGIPHVFDEYEGNHSNQIADRIRTKLLPFFSEILLFEMPPAGKVQPQ